ncbi:hypothetical protein [Streptomyces sp. SID3212]|uniref:hypothetical protein n=1 Tax=Streptomyces sp. SID3212 TaxID=2690259 RepID=UPI0013694AEB|nr:hypothetical protein [Streptomyces sp. SID3212]MYV58044.1 hypothetical protein [Streptomyces sp. SID3212]
MALLNKDAILKADDMVFEDIPVPEWGGDIRLKTMTGTQRDAFEDKSMDQRGKDPKMNLTNFRARLLALCIVNEDGRRVFSDGEITLLGQKSANVLERLFNKAREMNGMDDKDVEELTKGFSDVPKEVSTSD